MVTLLALQLQLVVHLELEPQLGECSQVFWHDCLKTSLASSLLLLPLGKPTGLEILFKKHCCHTWTIKFVVAFVAKIVFANPLEWLTGRSSEKNS